MKIPFFQTSKPPKALPENGSASAPSTLASQKSRKSILRNLFKRQRISAALKKSEARFRDLFENANDVIFTINLDGRFTSFNKTGEKLSGYSREEICNLKIADIILSDQLDLFDRNQLEKIDLDASIKHEAKLIAKNGEQIVVEINCRVIYEDDNPIGIQGIARDITDRMEMTEALKISEQYQNLFKHANDAIIILKPEDETILEANDKACELYGISYEDFIGRSLKSVPRIQKRDEGKQSKFYKADFYQDYETIHYRADGKPLHLLINASIIEYKGVRAILSVNHDISKRKMMEEALRQSEYQFRSVANSAQDAIVSADNKGNINFWNEGARRIFGYSEEEIVGKSLDTLMPERYWRSSAEGMQRYLPASQAHLTGQSVELRGLRKDGSEFPLDLSLGTWQHVDNKFFTGVMRDITERKKADVALRKSVSLLTSIFEATTDGMAVVDPYNKIKNFNKKFVEMWNLTEEIIKTQDSFQIAVHMSQLLKNPEDFLEKVKQVKEKRIKTDFSVWELKDGRTYESYVQQHTLEGIPIGWILTYRDITQHKQAEEERDRFFTLSHDLFCTTEFDGYFKRVNPAWESALGYSSEELLTKQFVDLIHPDDRRALGSEVKKLKDGEIVTSFEARMLCKDGSHQYFSWSAMPFISEGICYAVGRNITGRKQTESALLRSQSALNAIQDGVYMFSPRSLRFFYVNEGAIEQSGYSRKELLQMTPLDFRTTLSERMLRQLLARLTNGKLDSFTLTSAFRRKDGTSLPVEIILQYVPSENKEDLYVAVVRDVTERQQAQDTLEENLSLLTSTLEATAEGLLVVDLNNRIVTYNQKFIEIFELPEEILKTRDNSKSVDFVLNQLSNPEEFAENTKRFIANPELQDYDLLKFKNGKIYERYNHPQTTNGKVVGRVVSFRDITERTTAEENLQESQKRYQQLFESNPYPIWVYDVETLRILAVNQEALRHYGYSQEEFLQLTIKEIRPPEDIDLLLDSVKKAILEGEAIHIGRHLKKDGTLIDVEVASQSITFDGRQARLALITDITERRRAEAALRESEYKLRTLLGSMNEGLSQVSNDQIIEFVNDRFCEMTGYSRDELLGKTTFEVLLDAEGQKVIDEVEKQRAKGVSTQYELRLKKKSGDVLWVIVGGAPVVNADGIVTGSIGVFTDITERKLVEDKLVHDALHDNLTGLANRKLFNSHLQSAIERGKRNEDCLYAVLFLDFDRFKAINDSLGHAAGDSLLKQIARRLEGSLRSADLLARLGGDEFTILLNDLEETNDAIQIADRIKNDLNAPFIIGDQEIFMSASIGIALCHAGHNRAEDMLRDADIAMYRAKAKGKAQHQIFDQTMHKYAINKLQLETEMHHALQRGEFSLNYQPIVDLETNNLMGFEALIRWIHPERGMVLPSDFIPVAEENNLVIPLGRWILYESCRQMRQWQAHNPWASSLTVSVNLSSKQFLQFDLYEQVAGALVSTQLDPHCLKLEITESHVMENSDKAVSVMHRLRDIGVEISLDDFGTGYSSLSYLHRLPVNYLKIDRSFVSRMVESKENGEIVHTIVKLAQNLKMKVIAEGVENFEQLSQLKRLGCEYGQGYLISAPLDGEAAASFINDRIQNTIMLVNQPIINAELNM